MKVDHHAVGSLKSLDLDLWHFLNAKGPIDGGSVEFDRISNLQPYRLVDCMNIESTVWSYSFVSCFHFDWHLELNLVEPHRLNNTQEKADLFKLVTA